MPKPKVTCSKKIPTLVDVHKKNLQKRGYDSFMQWKEDSNHLYIARNMSFYVPGAEASIWGNKYSVKKYGLEKCLELYKEDVINSELYERLDELEGLELGCWCHDDYNKEHKCHGDILISLFIEKFSS
jgi:hypothetical protein